MAQGRRETYLQYPTVMVRKKVILGKGEKSTNRGVAEFVHDDSDAIAVLFGEDASWGGGLISGKYGGAGDEAHLRRVDFPAPRKPQIMVRGTLLFAKALVSSSAGGTSCSMSVLSAG